MIESVRYLMFLMGAYYFLQAMGGNPSLHIQALLKYLKEGLGYSPAQTSAFLAFITVPWMIKPVYGIISDFLPIFGSRRRNYFILVGFVAAGSYGLLSWSGTSLGFLSLYLFSAAMAMAFSDVLCDAVMVAKGQPLHATDRLQSAQWFALGLAGIVIAFSKGYIAEYLPLAEAVRLSMIAPLLMVVFTIVTLREERTPSSKEAAMQAWQGIREAAKSRPLGACAVFLFWFSLAPSLGTALYYYQKDVLRFSDVLIGHIDTVGSMGFVVGTIFFGVVAPRLSHAVLLRTIILTAVLTSLSYLFLRDAFSAFIIAGATAVVGTVAFLGPLTVAAKVCPKHVEGTVFALLMSLMNAGGQLGNILGGKLYDLTGYTWLVVISASFTATAWFLLPLVREKKEIF